ncbi:MarR family winged helix-turn-helix transcriptional regulator [Leucothrix pacifica]|uniref:HTH marR-type domain-containing protein n=1 Tax=Leucothrix pacifica TaxID=1247513 RepID=A0A317CE45_9GAMM|nr:MarR family transcriptional regulator [Leucothrix pacifica]PWQ96639.1 hypothetical protein DKW60_12715 [Leucothrix pacifica]
MSKPLRLHSLPGFWLRCLNASLNNNLQALLKDAEAGIAVSEWIIISILSERPGISINDLAHFAGMHQAPVSRIVEKLTQKSLVSRITSAEDRRSVSVQLTEEGTKLRDSLHGVGSKNAEINFACLDDEEYAAFMATIKKVLKHHHFDTTGY